MSPARFGTRLEREENTFRREHSCRGTNPRLQRAQLRESAKRGLLPAPARIRFRPRAAVKNRARPPGIAAAVHIAAKLARDRLLPAAVRALGRQQMHPFAA